MSDNVGELLTQRGNQWGDAIGTHVRIAQVWSGILNHEVQPVQAALMMEGLKLVRASINPSDPDSFHDAQGYDRIAELIAGHRDSLDEKKLEAHRNTTWLHALQDHRLKANGFGDYSCTCEEWSCGETTAMVEFDIHIVDVLQNTAPSDKMPAPEPTPNASTTVAVADATCFRCPHPKTSHQDITGILGPCQGYYYEGPGDKRYCQCRSFQALP